MAVIPCILLRGFLFFLGPGFLASISLEVTKINRRLRKLSGERAAFNLHAL